MYSLTRSIFENSDDALVEIALPEQLTGCALDKIKLLCGNGLERSYQAPQWFAHCRGGSRTAPTCISDGDDAVQVVWHYHVFIQLT